ncbi:MAG: hypothetical protein ABIG61_17840 [Planctomycetota bacterium]
MRMSSVFLLIGYLSSKGPLGLQCADTLLMQGAIILVGKTVKTANLDVYFARVEMLKGHC